MGRISRVIARLLNAVPAEEMEGIQLEGPFWEIEGRRVDYSAFFRRLANLVSDEAFLFLEGGSHPAELTRFMSEQSVPAVAKVARRTVWPRASVFHVPTKPTVLVELAALAEHCAGPEICDHLRVYRDDQVLLEWRDAFSAPLLVSKRIPEERMREFCGKLDVTFNEGKEESP